jgi:hypothetical protein
MWNNFINQISEYCKNQHSIKEYCIFFINTLKQEQLLFTPINLLTAHEIEDIINSSNGHLFPVQSNLHEFFNNGKLEYILNFIYHFPDINKSDLFNLYTIDEQVTNIDYSTLFNEQSPNFLYKAITFEPDFLLSQHNELAITSYLFLYFLPCISPNSLLFHFRKKIPLICCNQITLQSFNILLYLMKKFEPYELDTLCSGYNLNHLLLEDFISTAKNLYDNNSEIIWEKILPLDKIYKLIDVGCGFKEFQRLREKKLFFTFSFLPSILLFLEKVYLYNKMQIKLPIKVWNKKWLKYKIA